MTNYLPNELQKYLKYIHDINAERNSEIKKQILLIATLFHQKVNYVFIKGSAFLLSEPYNVMSERMIGDIDILVSFSDIKIAKDILINYGFDNLEDKSIDLTEKIKFREGRHLKRLIHPDLISSVELHTRLVDNPNLKLLKASKVLATKKLINKNCYVPTKRFLWTNALEDWQINDFGYKLNFISFKSIYDVLRVEPENLNRLLINMPKEIKCYYSMPVYYDAMKNI